MDGAKVTRPIHSGMYEVEQKAPADLDPLRTRLEDIGATYERTIEQRDTYFQHPTRNFAETDEALRIREIEIVDGEGSPGTELTYKGPRLEDEAKTRREFETAVDDGDTMRVILESLGFEPVATVTKHRERWRFDDATICLDAVDDLGSFVEVETASGREEIADAADRASTLMRELGIDADATTTDSYLGMLLEARS